MSLYNGKISELSPSKLFQLENDSKKYPGLTFLILFYAPWCTHCKEFMPLFQQMALELPQKIPNLGFAKIDGSKNKEELRRRSVKGYPTVMLLVNGDYKTFHGERNAKNLVRFIEENRAK